MCYIALYGIWPSVDAQRYRGEANQGSQDSTGSFNRHGMSAEQIATVGQQMMASSMAPPGAKYHPLGLPVHWGGRYAGAAPVRPEMQVALSAAPSDEAIWWSPKCDTGPPAQVSGQYCNQMQSHLLDKPVRLKITALCFSD